MDWSHIKKRGRRDTKTVLFWNPQGNRKRGRPRNSWKRSVIKEAGRSWNELRFLAGDTEVERTRRQPMFLEGTMDFIIIIIIIIFNGRCKILMDVRC